MHESARDHDDAQLVLLRRVEHVRARRQRHRRDPDLRLPLLRE
jgi:hypothetical protein